MSHAMTLAVHTKRNVLSDGGIPHTALCVDLLSFTVANLKPDSELGG